MDFLQTQFEIVGDDPQNAKLESTNQLNKESEHNYTLWCSGRVCCEGMLVELRVRLQLLLLSSDWVTVSTLLALCQRPSASASTPANTFVLQKQRLLWRHENKPCQQIADSDRFLKYPSRIVAQKVNGFLENFLFFPCLKWQIPLSSVTDRMPYLVNRLLGWPLACYNPRMMGSKCVSNVQRLAWREPTCVELENTTRKNYE